MLRTRPAALLRTRSAALAAGVAAALLLTGCADDTATTNNGVTPGPALPSGVTLPPDALQPQLPTPTETPSP